MTNLRLERKDEDPTAGYLGNGITMTPPIGEDFWSYRVCLTEGQAILGFPKFGCVGIGFAVEEDWNTNLPSACDAEQIYEHIEHNKGSDSISREDCITAIELIQAAVENDGNAP